MASPSPAEILPPSRPQPSHLKHGRELRRLDYIIGEMEIRLGRQCDPVVTLIELAAGHDEYALRQAEGMVESGVWDLASAEDRAKYYESIAVDRGTRLDAAKAAAKFVRPMLAATEVSGPSGGPIAVDAQTFPVTQLMAQDRIVTFVEDMAIELAGKRRQLNAAEAPAGAEGENDGGTSHERSDSDDSGQDGREHEAVRS